MEEPLFIEQFNAGQHSKGAGYSFFIPTKVNRQWQWADARLAFVASIKCLENFAEAKTG
jgi:hypothetical protein